MKLTAKDVKSMLGHQMEGFPWDEETVERVLKSFHEPVSMDTIMYRTADVLSGATILVGDDVTITSQSSITELDISDELYKRCTKAGVMTLKDIDRERVLSVLSFEDFADLTAAMLKIKE